MKTRQLLVAFFLIVFIYPISLSWGMAQEWKQDPAHSSLSFAAPHVFAKVHGSFAKVDYTVHFDQNDLEHSSLVIEVDVHSITTGVSKRDKHLLSNEFFDGKKYPTIKFASTKIEKSENAVYQISGNITVKGKTYPFMFPLQIKGPITAPFDKNLEILGFTAVLPIDRLSFAIGDGNFYKKGIIGKDIDIFLNYEGLKKK